MSKPLSSLTSAKFKMITSMSAHYAKYQCTMEDNLRPERYSCMSFVLQFSDIAETGLHPELFKKMLSQRHKFRKDYFDDEFLHLFQLEDVCFKEENLDNISTYDSNDHYLTYPGIDSVITWFCVFITDNVAYINLEAKIFKEEMKKMAYLLLKEYYLYVNHIPYDIMAGTIECIKVKCEKMSKSYAAFFRSFITRCKKCGLVNVDEETDPKHKCVAHVHLCQCSRYFRSHKDFIRHWLSPYMGCPIQCWLIWRLFVEKTFDGESNWVCNGCSITYSNFLLFWNHICYCGFFRLYMLIRCPFCNEKEKDIEFKNYESCQKYCQTPHADLVGIKVLKEWCKLEKFQYRCYLAHDDEINGGPMDYLNLDLSKINHCFV